MDILSPLIKPTDEAEEAVDIVGDSDHLVHEVIQVAVRSSHTKLSKYYRALIIVPNHENIVTADYHSLNTSLNSEKSLCFPDYIKHLKHHFLLESF